MVGAAFAALVACAQPGGSGTKSTKTPAERALQAPRQEVIDAFAEITGARAYGATPKLAKWSGELRVSIRGATDLRPDLVAELRDALAEIPDVTPLTVRYTDENPNFVVIFAGPKRDEIGENRKLLQPAFPPKSFIQIDAGIMQLRSARSLCNAFVVLNGQNGYDFFALVLGPDEKSPPGWCVMENVLKGIGIGYRGTRKNSVLNGAKRPTQLTDVDLAMIQTFYGPEIPPGMFANQAADKFEQLLKK
jgi:hypothetical protein